MECLCSDGTYDDNFSPDCQPCNFSCTTCSNGLNIGCQSCDLVTNKRDDDSLNGKCPCSDGFYEISDPICATCDLSCKTCGGAGKNNCTSCETTDDR